MGFAKEGYSWILGLSFIIFILYWISKLVERWWYWILFLLIAAPFGLFLVFIIFFFRDPKRKPDPSFSPNISILSPADGSISAIEEEGGDLAFYIEMHVSNVHVTRAHIEGRIKQIIRVKGDHYPIYYLKSRIGADSIAIRKNARIIIDFEDNLGQISKYLMICGKLARRAKPYVQKGQQVHQGQKIGIIQFGSLVKITLPGIHYNCRVKISEKVFAGKTILCDRIIESRHE
jgi:phosphatidylserine decarboxylase